MSLSEKKIIKKRIMREFQSFIVYLRGPYAHYTFKFYNYKVINQKVAKQLKILEH